MKLGIAGMGWVTPLGRGIDHVWARLLRGERATAQKIWDRISDEKYPAFKVPEAALEGLAPHARLRRASAISRFAAAAGLDAIACAKSTIGELDLHRLGLVFAVSNGGVTYTKRFYHDVIASGAQSASPLLFPETVFNAPASHLAAILGITGTSYTLVGDGAVGVLAVKMAADLLENDKLDACLVVGAEEADWILCDAYHRWRLVKRDPPIQLFSDPPSGTILSEGAGAVLIAREGPTKIEALDPGGNFFQRGNVTELLSRTLRRLAHKETCLIGSANGTFIDLAERAAAEKELPEAPVYSLKAALGESVGAGAVWQIIAAAQALRTRQLPPEGGVQSGEISCIQAIVLSCGLNQQVAGLRLAL